MGKKPVLLLLKESLISKFTMPRRPVGVGAIKKDKAAAERFKAKTAQLQESSFQAMTNQMETFREKLEEFARSHKQEIKKDPEFRRHFQVNG